MQRRFQRLLVNTIEYINNLGDSPFREKAVFCALDDMFRYSIYIDSSERSEYMRHLENIRTSYQKSSNFAHLQADVSEMRRATACLYSRICIDFIIQRQTHWGAVRPLVDAFQNAGCEVRLVPTPMIQEQQDRWGRALQKLIVRDGYPVTDFAGYNIETVLPDIVVDDMAVDCAKLPEFRFLRVASLVDHTVHIEHSILTGYNEAMKRSYFRIGRSRCWQYLVPSVLFEKALPLIMRIDGGYITEGCSEIDTVRRIEHQAADAADSDAPRLATVLWNIDALDPEREIPEDYARLEKEINYLEAVARKYPGLRSIVRTHPNFCNQTICEQLRLRLEEIAVKYENVIFDTQPLIYSSYRMADAMVTWLSSTTLFTFAATGKPLIALPTFIDGGYDTMLDMRLLEVIPIAYSERDIEDFIGRIFRDVDKDKRMSIITEYTGPIDGTASQRIAREVLSRYERRFS